MTAESLDQTRISFDERPEHLKVTIPVRRNWFSWLLLVVYSGLLVIWIGGLVLGIQGLWRNFEVNPDNPGFAVRWAILVVAGLVIWLWFGRRTVWRWWQYYVAGREILFINKDLLIVRRPVSILGLTDAYDMHHVSPLYFHDKHQCLAFDYGSRGILLAPGLSRRESDWLAIKLNDRYFPGWNSDDDDPT